jgi:hypothetical protein
MNTALPLLTRLHLIDSPTDSLILTHLNWHPSTENNCTPELPPPAHAWLYSPNLEDASNSSLRPAKPDWETYCYHVADMIVQEQTPKRVMEVRTKLYELLSHCIPPTVILKVMRASSANHYPPNHCAPIYPVTAPPSWLCPPSTVLPPRLHPSSARLG